MAALIRHNSLLRNFNLHFLFFTKRAEYRGTNVSEKLIVVPLVKIYPSLMGRVSVLRGEPLKFEWRISPTCMESTGKYIRQWTTKKLRLSSFAVGGQISAHSIKSSVVQNDTQGPKSQDSLKRPKQRMGNQCHGADFSLGS